MLLDIRTMSKDLQTLGIIGLIFMAITLPIMRSAAKVSGMGTFLLIAYMVACVFPALVSFGIIFKSEKKDRLDTLYAMLPVTHNDIITSRYLFVICMMLIISLLALPYLLITTTREVIVLLPGIFLMCMLYVFIPYPLLLKWNPEKIISFMGFGFGLIAIPACSQLPNGPIAGIIQIASPGSFLLMVLAVCVLIYLSYLLSCNIYRKRDSEIGHYKNNAIKKEKFYENCEKKITGLYSINKMLTLILLYVRAMWKSHSSISMLWYICLYICIGILIYSSVNKDSVMSILLLIAYSSWIPSLFTVFDRRGRNKMEILYTTLPLTRSDIVKSNYFLSIFMLAGVVFAILLLSLYNRSQYLYLITAAIFPIPVLIMSFAHPCLFKWGYSNMWFLQLIDALTVPIYRSIIASWGHRHARWIPALVNGMVMVIFFSIVGLLTLFFIKNIDKINACIAANPVTIFSLLYGGSLILFYSSCRLSCRFYAKRDL